MMKEFFLLETRRTTYCFRVTEQGFLQHLYYGRRLDLAGGLEALVPQVRDFPGNGAGLDGVCLEDMALEVSGPGLGDLRESMVIVRTAEGDTLTDFRFEGAEALEEKQARGIIWVGVQGLGFLFSASLCLIATRAALKRRKNTREKRKNHENTAFDTERY